MASGIATETGTCASVDMGRIVVARDSESLRAILGSCIGVTLYHPRFRIGAMAHVVLPKSSARSDTPGRFADTAIPRMIQLIENAGANRSGIVAKMTGGARMFGKEGPLQVGLANTEAVSEVLAKAGIRVVGTDLGGSNGRRVTFDAANGDLTIEVVGAPPRTI